MSWINSVSLLLRDRRFKQQLDDVRQSRKIRDAAVNNNRSGFKKATPEENRRRVGGSRGAFWKRTNRNGTGPRNYKGPGPWR